MKMLLEIPCEFEEHFERDKFKDSLERLKYDANCLAGLYEKELADMLIVSFEKAEIVE